MRCLCIDVSFSGGKDSTVLLDLVRQDYSNVTAVFCDTGLEYPEIRQFVKTFDNVEWLKPKMGFKKVVEKYGYPFISKEVSNTLHYARHCKTDYAKSRVARLMGTYLDPDGNKSRYCCEKWGFMLNAPFDVGDKCCQVMKKSPTKQYENRTGKKPLLAMMACESRKRAQGWVKSGCNGFDLKRPQSNPMAFWTEQDVLYYIHKNKLKICSVYGDIIEEKQLPGQMSWDEYIGFDVGTKKLTTTGCKRTGCMFCGYGCHLDAPGEGRFELMKKTHPKQYDYIMRPWEQGGLNYKEVIDWINEHGNMSIKY